SADSQGAQVSRSVTVGLFAGGAHRTAATILAPISRWPSPAATDVGWAASPHRYSDANRTSPLRSPVKTRPVRLPPWAAGARPTISTAGRPAAPAGVRAPPSPPPARRARLARRPLPPPFDQPRAGPADGLPGHQLGHGARPGGECAHLRRVVGHGGRGGGGVTRPAGPGR